MSVPFLTGINLNGQRATNVGDPSAGTDAANKQYVDNTAAGLKWKQAVRIATTGNGALASAFAAGSSIDGVALVAGDRILLKNQSTASQNGIYVVQSSGAPVRATDADTAAELKSAIVNVAEGTTNADTAWQMVTDTVTLETTSLVWSAFAAGQVYTQGTGVSISGQTIAIDTSIVARKGSADCVATTNPQTFTDNLGTKDKQVVVRRKSDDVIVQADVTVGLNDVTVDFGGAPSAAQYRVTVIG